MVSQPGQVPVSPMHQAQLTIRLVKNLTKKTTECHKDQRYRGARKIELNQTRSKPDPVDLPV